MISIVDIIIKEIKMLKELIKNYKKCDNIGCNNDVPFNRKYCHKCLSDKLYFKKQIINKEKGKSKWKRIQKY